MNIILSDEEVVQRVRAGDRESYGLLAVRHRQKLHRIAQKYVRTASEAEDAVQGAHLLALNHFDQFEGRSTYVQWMATITHNQIRGDYRHCKVQTRSEELRDCHASASLNPEQLAIRSDVRHMVRSALKKLPPRYRLVLWMRDLAEFSTAETGRRLGVTDACVKTRLHRARSLLRDVIGRQFGSPKHHRRS